jgi:hypothetical protein
VNGTVIAGSKIRDSHKADARKTMSCKLLRHAMIGAGKAWLLKIEIRDKN